MHVHVPYLMAFINHSMLRYWLIKLYIQEHIKLDDGVKVCIITQCA